MTKHIFQLIIIALFYFTLQQTAGARVWTVSNNSGDHANFATLQLAHDGANSGDTLYVFGSETVYNSLTLTKKLTIIGTGYFLTQNPNTQARKLNAQASAMNFKSGSEGSEVIGMHIGSGNQIFINANNITLKRNYIYGQFIIGKDTLVTNVFVLQNYIEYWSSGIEIRNLSRNIFFFNNYIRVSISGYNGRDVGVQNNIVFNGIFIHSAFVHNNILIDGDVYGENSTVSNNLSISSSAINTVFVDTGSPDGKWKLKPGSPAIGAGVGGVDCGMYGGDNPYVLSGIPAIPSIYFFNAPIEGGNLLPVQIKIKSNK
ncbi:MAG: hypothetical protein KGZ58_00045 [Ignavibacteriales bacterium]|nr:hypothetical protein [Ignavibacteriales bacterium]